MGCRLPACSTQRVLSLQLASSSLRAQRISGHGLGSGSQVPGILAYPGYLSWTGSFKDTFFPEAFFLSGHAKWGHTSAFPTGSGWTVTHCPHLHLEHNLGCLPAAAVADCCVPASLLQLPYLEHPVLGPALCPSTTLVQPRPPLTPPPPNSPRWGSGWSSAPSLPVARHTPRK